MTQSLAPEGLARAVRNGARVSATRRWRRSHLVLLGLLAIVVLRGVGVTFMAETFVRRSGALVSLRTT